MFYYNIILKNILIFKIFKKIKIKIFCCYKSECSLNEKDKVKEEVKENKNII